MLAALSIVIAYLLGSISSSYVIARLLGKCNLKTEGDGAISAAAVYKHFGKGPFLLVVILDMSLAALGVIIARNLTGSDNIALIAGLAAVIGHNWSIFLNFRGGLGATAIGGVLAAVSFFPFLVGLGIAALVMVVTRRPGISTAVGIVVVSIILLFQFGIVLAIYPLALFLIMILKRTQKIRFRRIPSGNNSCGKIK
jgi:glycerol-3-phosphate acyltransferase PlsY